MNQLVRDQLNLAMIRLADGDRSAFEFVFTMSSSIVHKLALRAMKSQADADDVSQQTLMKVFARAAEFDRSRDALSWILGITVFECKTFKQKHRRRKENLLTNEDLNSVVDQESSAEEQLLKVSVDNAVKEIVSGMSIVDQQVIFASVGEYSRPDVNPATYRKRLQRAMDKLRFQWGERYEK